MFALSKPIPQFQHDPAWVDRNWGLLFALAAGVVLAVFLLIVYNWPRPTR